MLGERRRHPGLLDAAARSSSAGIIRSVAAARKRLREAVPGLGVPDEHSFPPGRFDTTRLVLLLSVRCRRIEIERRLIDKGLPLELADRDTIVAIVSVADDESTLDRLVSALMPANLRDVGAASRPGPSPWAGTSSPSSPSARGRTSSPPTVPSRPTLPSARLRRADSSSPPGIPVLARGKLVTETLLSGLEPWRRTASA